MEGCYGTTDLTTALEMETLPLPQTAHFERRAASKKKRGASRSWFLVVPHSAQKRRRALPSPLLVLIDRDVLIGVANLLLIWLWHGAA